MILETLLPSYFPRYVQLIMEPKQLDIEDSGSGSPFQRKSKTQLWSINSKQELDVGMVTAIADLSSCIFIILAFYGSTLAYIHIHYSIPFLLSLF